MKIPTTPGGCSKPRKPVLNSVLMAHTGTTEMHSEILVSMQARQGKVLTLPACWLPVALVGPGRPCSKRFMRSAINSHVRSRSWTNNRAEDASRTTYTHRTITRSNSKLWKWKVALEHLSPLGHKNLQKIKRILFPAGEQKLYFCSSLTMTRVSLLNIVSRQRGMSSVCSICEEQDHGGQSSAWTNNRMNL